MKAIVCEKCGGQDLVKQDGMFVCQNCGTKYSPDETGRLLIEVSGSVTVDNGIKLQNYYELAKRAASDKNYDDAAKYYTLMLQEDPHSWEAQYYSIHYTVYQSIVKLDVSDIPKKAVLLMNTAKTTFLMISASSIDANTKGKAVSRIAIDAETALDALFLLLKAQSGKILFAHQNGEEYYHSSTKAISSALNGLSNALAEYVVLTDDDEKSNIEVAYVLALKNSNRCLENGWSERSSVQAVLSKETLQSEYAETLNSINENTTKIRKIDPNYTPPELWQPKSGHCYVATAIYGSYNCPQVWILRRYRDNTLAARWYGRVFISAYYAISPALVKHFGQTAWFRKLWKPILDRIVEKLRQNGVEDKPYFDKVW